MIKLEPGGRAPILSYNVPEPTSYSGTGIVELSFEYDPDEKPYGIFKAEVGSAAGAAVGSLAVSTDAVRKAMHDGFQDPILFSHVRLNSGRIWLDDSHPEQSYWEIKSTEPVGEALRKLTPDLVTNMFNAGRKLNVFKTLYGELNYGWLPIEPPQPRLLLVEHYRLSSYLGAYGAGRTIKTFTLLPGEKTRISVKTYTRQEKNVSNASSILDSFDQASSEDFEKSVQQEQSDKTNSSKSLSYYVDAEVSANWGWGNASVKAGVKGGSNSAREEFSKNISNATSKHAARASAKRDVQVNTTTEVKEQSGEETSTEREIQNINVSRTLNFVFRQMNQEFITILHLVDVRVAYFDGTAETKREVPLTALQSLLDQYVNESEHETVRQAIMEELSYVFDYQDNPHALIEKRTLLKDPTGSETPENILTSYFRVRKNMNSVYKDGATGTEITVPGIIMAAEKNVMRTDGIIVDALLGNGDALDQYSHGLQDEAVRSARLANDKLEAEVQREKLGQQVITSGNTAAAALFPQIYPAPVIQNTVPKV
jgi:hypothetical protein